MARVNTSALRSKLRQAQRQMESAVRRAQYELEHPQIRISCTCGYRSNTRRSVRAMPRSCPSCGAPIIYR